MIPWSRAVGITLVTWGCGGGDPSPHPGRDSVAGNVDTLPSPSLIDSTISPALAGLEGWNYQQSTQADLNGDGELERVVLTAQVELYRGRPAWDDGQPWQVYIEAPDGTPTYLYAQRLQLGTLTARLGLNDAGQPATVVLLVQLPDQMSLYEIAYGGPGHISVVKRFQRNLDPRGDNASPPLP